MLQLTKTERKAVIFIASVILVSIIVQWILPHQAGPEYYDYTLEDSLFKALSRDTTAQVEEIKVKPREQLEKSDASNYKNVLLPNSININLADQKELERLPRIGPVTAKAIIEYRKQHGPFKRPEDLQKVRRIGPKTVEKIKPYIIIEE